MLFSTYLICVLNLHFFHLCVFFSGNRLAAARGRDVGGLEEETEGRRYQFISEVLRWRAHSTPDHELFTLLNAKGTVSQSMTCSQLHKKAERIACLLIGMSKF